MRGLICLRGLGCAISNHHQPHYRPPKKMIFNQIYQKDCPGKVSSKWLIALKLVLFCLLSQTAALGQNLLKKPVNLHVKSATVPEALAQLSKQNNLPLAYSEHFFNKKKTVKVRVRKRPVGEVLEIVLEGTGVGMKEVGGQIVLYLLPEEAAQEFTLSGFVEDAETGERLIAAAVYCPELGYGTVTNDYGFYSLTLPANAENLRFSYIGYNEQTVKLHHKQDQRISQAIAPALTLAEVIVTPMDSSIGNLLPSPGSMRRFRPEDFKSVPDLGGQSDLFRALQLLPGIQSGVDGTGGMFIRGGNADQNLVLLDGVPVYNADHLMGLFSIFNTSAIRSTKLLKGGMPARYGGRISSVMDVYTKEGNQNRWSGELGGDLINAKASLEGPFAGKKGSLMVSARRSHTEFYLKPFVERLTNIENFDQSNFNFADFNTKINYHFSEKDKLYLSFYKGSDHFDGSQSTGFGVNIEESTFEVDWGNTITSLRWNHLFSQKLFSNTSLTYSRFRFSQAALFKAIIDYQEPGVEPFLLSYFAGLQSDIRDLAFKTDFDFSPSANHYFRFGGGVTAHRILPNASSLQVETQNLNLVDSLTIDEFFNQQAGSERKALSFDAYGEDEWRITPQLTVNYGLRLAGFYHDRKTFLLPEPRLSAAYSLTQKQKLTASIARTTQFLHRVSTSAIAFPSDFWTPSSSNFQPQKAWQGTIGMEIALPKRLELSVEAYYKHMKNLLALPDSFFIDPVYGGLDPEEFIFQMNGKSRGLEVMLRRESGRLGGWAGYSLSKATRQSDFLNDGKPFAFNFDRRHEFKCFGYYRLGQHWQASFNWVFGSPSPKVSAEIGPIPTPAGLNGERGNPYHRLDLAVAFNAKTGKLEHQLKFSVYNAYNHKNVAFYRIIWDFDNNIVDLEPVYLFPAMLGAYYGVKF